MLYIFGHEFFLLRANLSNDYFTNRQDRYIYIKNSPNVADYFDDLVKTVSNFSLQLHDNNTTTLDTKRFSAHPYKEWDKGKRFKQSAKTLVQEFTKKWTRNTRSNFDASKGDTLVFPLLQMGPFGITQDEEVTSRIFENAPEGSLSHLATGYFNLTSCYLNQILKSKGRYLVLCAHPLANGFYKAGGIIGMLICLFYQGLITQFTKIFKKLKQQDALPQHEKHGKVSYLLLQFDESIAVQSSLFYCTFLLTAVLIFR